MVPEGWRFERLGKVAEFQRGFDLPSKHRVEGNIPIISSSGVSGFHNEAKVQAPGVVTGRYGSIGSVFYVDRDFWPLNTALWVKNFQGNYPLFIYYLLSKFDFKKFSDKTGVPGVNRNDLHAVKVFCPPLMEQKKIAQILSTWDKAITTAEQLLANSQQQKKALMQQLLTGKKRMLDENGVRFSGEWSKIAIGKLIKEIRKEKESTPNAIELLTVKLHYKGVAKTGKFPNATERGRPYFKRFAGELIVGRQNLHNGGVAIVSEECNGLIASNAISSFDARSGFDIRFILSLMSTEHFRFTVDNLAGGTGQKEIGLKTLLSLSVVVPNFQEQQKIATVLSVADQEITILRQKLDSLKQEKKALMQQLLTGKRRVKVDEEAA